MHRDAVHVGNRLPVEMMRELELKRIDEAMEATKIQVALSAQTQIAGVWLSTPSDSTGLRVRQVIDKPGSEPITVETIVEMV